MKIVVAGCVAQAEGEEVLQAPARRRSGRRTAELSPPAGTADARRSTARASDRHGFRRRGQIRVPAPPSRAQIRARGVSRLRHRAGRLRQVLLLLRRALYARRGSLAARRPRSSPRPARLVDAGVREITLIGQNVNAYRGPDDDGREWSLARLLDRLGADRRALTRLRYTTSHPVDMAQDLIDAHASLDQSSCPTCICPCNRARTAC